MTSKDTEEEMTEALTGRSRFRKAAEKAFKEKMKDPKWRELHHTMMELTKPKDAGRPAAEPDSPEGEG